MTEGVLEPFIALGFGDTDDKNIVHAIKEFIVLWENAMLVQKDIHWK